MRQAGFGGSTRRKRADLTGLDEFPADTVSRVSFLMVPMVNWSTGSEALCKRRVMIIVFKKKYGDP